MDRLTHRDENGKAFAWVYADLENQAEVIKARARTERKVLEKLANYEDAEEQGRNIGRWEECDWVFYDGHSECIHIPRGAIVCTNCRRAFEKDKLKVKNFCPNCGCRMEMKK